MNMLFIRIFNLYLVPVAEQEGLSLTWAQTILIGFLTQWSHYVKPAKVILLFIRTFVKSVYRKNDFLISQPKHMLCGLKRTVSMRRFF